MRGNGGEYVKGGAKAEVLWESFGTSVSPSVGDLVTNAGCKNNYVSVEVPETYREGNAVIAVRNSAGKILWSWHIWLTDQPAECVLPNGAGTIMDRNLGATDKAADRIESYGLLYQWGRKDPFMGEAGWNFVHTAFSAGTEWTNKNAEIQGEEYWIANPMDYTSWDVFDETLWEPDKKKRQDPCPAGWRVPACNENDNFWASVAGCLNNSSAFKSTEYGLTLTISTPSTWFPCVGWGTDPFSVKESGGQGYYWLAYYHNHSYGIHNYYSPVLELESMLYHLNCAVRCIKE